MLVRDSNRLRLFVRAAWRDVIDSSDQQYIEALLDDFRDRAKSEPDMLFRQASSLSVGPIVTHETGSLSGDESARANLLQGLVEVVRDESV